MKKHIQFSNYILATIIALTIGCKKDDPTAVPTDSSAKVLVEIFPEEPDNTYSIQVVDAATGEPIGLNDETKINVLFTGKDASTIKTLEGTSATSFETHKGLLAVSSSKSGSIVDPFDVKAVAQLSGYVSTSKRIKTYAKGREIITIPMVKISNTPNGVSAKTDNSISLGASGSTAQTTITSPTVTSSNTKTTVTVPAGVIMKDKNGATLTGTINSTLVYFNNEDDESLSAFPGGFEAEVTRNGTTTDGNFITAGFISLEMKDANGTKVSTFSKPISIKTEVPATTINPNTGNAIQNGETIDVWSYDTETGSWKYENTASFTGPIANGNFEATMSATHLSYWNLDWFYGNGCSTGATIKFNVPSLTVSKYINFDLIFKNSGKLYAKRGRTVKNGEQFTFLNAPNQELIIKPGKGYCNSSTSPYSGQLAFNACSGSYDLNLTKTNSSAINISVDISAYCKSNPSTVIKPTGYVYAYKINGCGGSWIYLARGKTTIYDVELGANYGVYFYYNGKSHFRTLKVESGKTNYTLTGEIPNGLGCK